MADNKPLLDQLALQEQFGGYTPPEAPQASPSIPFEGLDMSIPMPSSSQGERTPAPQSLEALENSLLSIRNDDKLSGGSVLRSIKDISSDRYQNFMPGAYNNEDAYAQGQSWSSKMINGVGKGLLLTGTTFLQSTVGLVNGLVKAASDGRAASFYDNDLNKWVDEINKKAENYLPNYYKDVETNASWYSPTKLLTANFFWDGIIKNLGFSAGAALAGNVFAGGIGAASKALSSLPKAGKLFSLGRAAEALAVTEEGLLAADKAAETYGKIKSLSDKFLNQYNVLNPGSRALVAGLSTTGEAGFEAYQNLNQFRTDRINEYKTTHGGMEPMGEALAKINENADAVGNASFLANVGLLSATNYIQFPKILGSSYRAEKGIVNDLVKGVEDITEQEGKYVSKTATQQKGILSTLKKVAPYTFSASEAFEEGAQYAIQTGTQDYYNKRYNNKDTSFLDSIGVGIQQTLGTNEGMSNVLMGGLSGSLMMAHGRYTEGKELRENTEAAINSFTKYRLSDFTKDTIDSVNRGTALQEEREALLKQGNITDSKDIEHDYIINYLTPRIKYGRYDLVKSEIEDYRRLAMTDEGFSQLQSEGKALTTDKKEAYLERLNKFEQTAENAKSLYQSLHLRYGGMVNDKKTPIYPPEVMDKLVYASSKISNYDSRIPGLTPGLVNADIEVNTVINDLLEGDDKSYNEAMTKLNSLGKVVDASSKTVLPEEIISLKENLEDVAKMSLRRNKFLEEYNDIKKNPSNYQTIEDEEEVAETDTSGKPIPKKNIIIKTKSGDKTITIGQQYVIGKITRYDKNNNEVAHAPVIKIVQENDNGTIKIFNPTTKTTTDISKETLLGLNIQSYDAIKADPKSNFLYENRDTTYEHYGIKDKDGNPVKGKLAYNPTKDRLTFEYKDENGVVKKSEVWNTHFKAKPGFKDAMVRPVGKISNEATTAARKFADAPITISRGQQIRQNIITELYENSVNRVKQISEKLEKSKEKLEEHTKTLEDLRNKAETVTNKKTVNALKKQILDIESLRVIVEKEVNELSEEKSNLENSIPFFKEFLDSLDSLPVSGAEIKDQIKDDIYKLDDLLETTTKALIKHQTLLDKAKAILKDSLNLLNEHIQKIKEANPGIPLSIAELEANLDQYSEGVENFDKTAFTALVVQLESDISDFEKGLKIVKLTASVDKLEEQVKSIQSEIDAAIAEQTAKEKIISTFEKFVETYKERLIEERKLQSNEALAKQLIGTKSTGSPNMFGKGSFEVAGKKNALAVLRSGRPIDKNKPAQKRIDKFTKKYNSLNEEDKKKFKVIIVTSNTEEKAGLLGLTSYMLKDLSVKEKAKEENNPKKSIVLVIVNEKGELVDQNGEVIKSKDTNVLERAVYQSLPSEELKGDYPQKSGSNKYESMFREDIVNNDALKKDLEKQYKEWRDDQLSNTQLDEPQPFDASFGSPEYSEKWDDKSKSFVRDYNKRVSAEKAGLLQKGTLKTARVITVPTTNQSVTENSSTFNTPFGRVVLRIPNVGLAKLFNRKFSEKEATAIYDVLHQITKNAAEEGTVGKESKSAPLFEWLQSVAYWGIVKDSDGKPKPAGYNNMWFQKVNGDTKLFISGLSSDADRKVDATKGFSFTPNGLEQEKTAIIYLIQQLYNHTDANKVNGSNWKNPYTEQLGKGADGNLIERVWPNYQTYKLSDKAPDESGNLTIERSGDEIPLTTQFRALKDEDDVNRTGTYFTLTGTVDNFALKTPVLAPKKQVTPTKQVVKPLITTPTGIVEGERPLKSGGVAKYTIDRKRVLDELKSQKEDILDDPQSVEFSAFIKLLRDEGILLVTGVTEENLNALSSVLSQLSGESKDNQFALQFIYGTIFKESIPSILNYNKELIGTESFMGGEEVTTSLINKGDDLRFQGGDYQVIKITAKGVDVTNLATGTKSFISNEDLAEEGIEVSKPEVKKTTKKQASSDIEAKKAKLEKEWKEELKLANFYLTGLGKGTSLTQLGLATVEGLGNMHELLLHAVPFKELKVIMNNIYKLIQDLYMKNKFTSVTYDQIENSDEIKAYKDYFDSDKINAKYEKELAKLNEQKEELPTEPDSEDFNTPTNRQSKRFKPFRLKLNTPAEKFEKEDWEKIEEFFKKVLPTIPLYRLKNMIKATNGRQAWGMLHKGGVYVYENAEVGTAYHEVFEAIWSMFTSPKERQAIIDEFRNREGTYKDRFTGEIIQYKTASEDQIREELAEEFRDFVITNKNVANPTYGKSLISRMFAELVDFIRTFFTGKNARTNTANLFSKIGNGYYAEYNPYESKLSYAKRGVIDRDYATADEDSTFRLTPKIITIPSAQVHDIIQQMTFATVAGLMDNNDSVFAINKIPKSRLYNDLRANVLDSIKYVSEQYAKQKAIGKISDAESKRKISLMKDLFNNVKLEWDNIVALHEQKLKSYNVEFDENDETVLRDEDNSGKGEYGDATKIDSFRKANSTIKLLFATLPQIESGSNGLDFEESSIGGVMLIPADQVYIQLLNKLHDSVDIDEMFNRLQLMAQGNPNYAALYNRLTKKSVTTDANKTSIFTGLKDYDLELISEFWKTMKKQNADVISVFVLPSGEVVVTNSTLSSAANQAKRKLFNSIVNTIKEDESPYFSYDSKTGKYSATDILKKLTLESDKLEQYTTFLKNIGISFTSNDLKKLDKKQLGVFRKAVDGIRTSFAEKGPVYKNNKAVIDEETGEPIDNSIKTFSNKTLDIVKQLTNLSILKAIVDSDTDFESTYFNINGERSQAFVGTNAISNLYTVLSKLKNIKELEETPYAYLLTDKFSQGSVVLQSMFDIGHDDATGNRIEDSENLLHPIFVDGTINEATGKKKASAKQSLVQRIIQELNLNAVGIYLNLVPGDATIEHASRMHNDGSPFVTAATFRNNSFINIFKNYFMSEVGLARDGRTVVKGKKAKDLRFFKAIFADDTKKKDNEINKLHNDIMNFKKDNGEEATSEELYKEFKTQIDNAVRIFINKEATNTDRLLRTFGIVYYDETGLVAKDLLFAEGMKLTEATLREQLKLITVNYMIANIEYHKLLYSDPYQYADELKRVRNFTSPGQALITGSVNEAYDKAYNRGYSEGDIGWTDMDRNYYRSISVGDVLSTNDLDGYNNAWKETDGAGIITLKANRIFGIRTGNWNDSNDKQVRYDVAYEKVVKGEGLSDEEKQEKGLVLNDEEIAFDIKRVEDEDGRVRYIGNNPNVRSTYTPRKPIIRGSKVNGRNYNDVVLHKLALVPYSFRILHEMDPNSNAIKLYNKMQAEDVDYAVFESGSKVGTEAVFELYKDGIFNTDPFETEEEKNNSDLPQGVSKIPFSIIALQADVPSKDSPKVTQGSQVTKLVTMDFLEGGMPIDFEVKDAEGNIITDFDERLIEWIALDTDAKREEASPLYKEIQNNQKLLEAKLEQGYYTLLRKLGIKETINKNNRKEFRIIDREKLITTLGEEIEKREINNNIIDSFAGFASGDTILEATPSYQQIRNILYSIADTNITSPKISGGMKVQITSALFESKNRIKTTEITDKKTGNKKTVYSSKILKFYEDEDGKRYCEIMVGRWFKSDKTDEELIRYFNETEEGKAEMAALFGVAYRIPTQKQNSIDVFKIAKFLPEDFGDSVVVPSAIVNKVGSDFDIDKLSIYLKNLKTGANGYPTVIKYLTKENSTLQERYAEWVLGNSTKDSRKYVKFLSKDKILAIRDKFKPEFDRLTREYKATIADIKGIAYSELLEDYDDIKNEFTEQDDEIAKLFKLGKKIFRKLGDSPQSEFFMLRDYMAKNNIQGTEEIRKYLAMAEDMLDDNEFGDETNVVLGDLISNYKQELRILGANEEYINNAKKEALVKFRKSKSGAIEGVAKLTSIMKEPILSKMKGEETAFYDSEYITELARVLDLMPIEKFSTQSEYQQNSIKALENAYIQSLQNLISHPLNFKSLIKPNSAESLKQLSIDINDEMGIPEVDYSSVGNMMSRTFMSKLRYAFVSGKYAIGIAATAQTNHANNQRSLTYVNTDKSRSNSIDPVDRTILGGDSKAITFANDPNVNFKEYNKVKIGGKIMPSLSMIKNAAGEYISDIIGMFIDGYVDIAAGAWVMDIGAAPNVASTWLFLTKIGVPIKTIGYFMNQPIINDYLKSVENRGYSWLFIEDMINDTLESYKPKSKVSVSSIPSDGDLFKMLKYNKSNTDLEEGDKLTDLQKSQQQYMLKEFLKYAKMAEQLFLVTQGSNFDTATINDPYLITKKRLQLERAQNTIISSVDNLLEKSYIGKLKDFIYDFRDAFAEILLSDKPNVRNVMEQVITPYVDLNDREFVKLAQKAVNTLFDWAVQTKPEGLNSKIASILLGNEDEKSAAEQIIAYRDSILGNETKGIPGKPEHELYHNIILNSIEQYAYPGYKKGKVNNLELTGRDNKIYDQNLIISGFEELKQVLISENKDLYRKLVSLSMIQSGLTNSPIAFTTLLPYEDFREEYNDVLSVLENIPNLDDFYNLNVFERTNANDSNVVAFKRAKLLESKRSWGDPYYNPDIAFLDERLKSAQDKGTIPKVVNISVYSQEGKSDFMTYQWESSIGNATRIQRRKIGDKSHVHKVLMKKVYYFDAKGIRKPFIEYSESEDKTTGEVKIYKKYLYKAINAWGDSYRANEFYDKIQASVLDNDYDKVKEVEDADILEVVGVEQVDKNEKYASDDYFITKGELLEDYSQTTGETLGTESRNAPKGFPETKRPNENCGG